MVLGWMTNLSDEGEELPGLKIANMFRDFLAGKYVNPEEGLKQRQN